MNTTPTRRAAAVRRITVDERLTEDLIRIEICELAHSGPEFADRMGEWGEATDLLVRSGDYVEAMGIPAELVPRWPWTALTEGMAFLSGAFEKADDPSAALLFRIAPERRAFVRIDNLDAARACLKEIYSRVLTEGRDE